MGVLGIAPAVVGWFRLEDEPPLDQTEFLRDRLPDYDTLRFEPGSQGVYTNVGYYALGSLIERVSGSQETVDEMLYERHVEAGSSGQWSDYTSRYGDDFVQGIGWRVVQDADRPHYSHGGGGQAFAALMRLYPDEGLGIVLLANGTNLDDHAITDAIASTGSCLSPRARRWLATVCLSIAARFDLPHRRERQRRIRRLPLG